MSLTPPKLGFNAAITKPSKLQSVKPSTTPPRKRVVKRPSILTEDSSPSAKRPSLQSDASWAPADGCCSEIELLLSRDPKPYATAEKKRPKQAAAKSKPPRIGNENLLSGRGSIQADPEISTTEKVHMPHPERPPEIMIKAPENFLRPPPQAMKHRTNFGDMYNIDIWKNGKPPRRKRSSESGASKPDLDPVALTAIQRMPPDERECIEFIIALKPLVAADVPFVEYLSRIDPGKVKSLIPLRQVFNKVPTLNFAQAVTNVDESQMSTSLDERQMSTSLDESQIPASLDERQMSKSLDESRIPASLDESRIPANLNEHQMSANLDELQLPARTRAESLEIAPDASLTDCPQQYAETPHFVHEKCVGESSVVRGRRCSSIPAALLSTALRYNPGSPASCEKDDDQLFDGSPSSFMQNEPVIDEGSVEQCNAVETIDRNEEICMTTAGKLRPGRWSFDGKYLYSLVRSILETPETPARSIYSNFGVVCTRLGSLSEALSVGGAVEMKLFEKSNTAVSRVFLKVAGNRTVQSSRSTFKTLLLGAKSENLARHLCPKASGKAALKVVDAFENYLDTRFEVISEPGSSIREAFSFILEARRRAAMINTQMKRINTGLWAKKANALVESAISSRIDDTFDGPVDIINEVYERIYTKLYLENLTRHRDKQRNFVRDLRDEISFNLNLLRDSNDDVVAMGSVDMVHIIPSLVKDFGILVLKLGSDLRPVSQRKRLSLQSRISSEFRTPDPRNNQLLFDEDEPKFDRQALSVQQLLAMRFTPVPENLLNAEVRQKSRHSLSVIRSPNQSVSQNDTPIPFQ